jgi:signal transduction histidine kinase
VIDKRIENEMQIHQSLEKEIRLNELKSRFISTASHEFKTPLTVIKSTIEVLKLYIDLDKPAINLTESLQVINSEVDDLSELLNDILILEKLERKKTTFEAECVDIIAWLQNLIGKFSTGSNETRKPELICFLERRNIYVDIKLMDKVITNLLSNAFKYSAGKPNPIMEVTFLDNEVTIAVKDFGIGIPEADIGQLFDSFYRARNVGNIEGTGLGLSIVKNFVQLHNGYVEVFSKINEGSKFVIHLPQ